MSETFRLDHRALAAEPRLADLAGELGGWHQIDSHASFNEYCRLVCQAWVRRFGVEAPSTEFADLLAEITRQGPGTIPTGWGGVVVTRHEPPRVEKYLVVRQGGYLALEKHARKDEHLEVRAGAGLLLSRQTSGEPLLVQVAAAGDHFHFSPGQEHCLIGVGNLLVFERSFDPKGMDQDLIFLYEPD